MKKILLILTLAFTVALFAGCGSDGIAVDGLDDPVTPHAMNDDDTGSWKVVTIAQSGIEPEDFAPAYYAACFEDGDTAHWIVNFGTNTTTSIVKTGNQVFVTCYEYVDGEEHSAKDIGTGQLYGEWLLNPDTGKMEKLQ